MARGESMDNTLGKNFTPVILAFDTTSQQLSIALQRDGRVLAALVLEKKGKHSIDFMPALDRLLKTAGVAARDVELICCATGPGSFTGLRIGMATAEALAFALRIPAIGFSSMMAEAHIFRAVDKPVLIAYDARGGRLYAGLYRAGREILAPTQVMKGELAEKLAPVRDAVDELIVIGDGAANARAQLLEAGIPDTAFRDGNPIARYGNRSAALCDLGLAYAKAELAPAALREYGLYRMEPLYLAATQAERMKREHEVASS